MPGLPGVSENIEVISVIDRFLEHSRIFYFLNDGQEEIYCASSDLMGRNLYHRVETCFPIESTELKQSIKTEILDLMLDPNQKRWTLSNNCQYCHHGKQSSQEILLKEYS